MIKGRFPPYIDETNNEKRYWTIAQRSSETRPLDQPSSNRCSGRTSCGCSRRCSRRSARRRAERRGSHDDTGSACDCDVHSRSIAGLPADAGGDRAGDRRFGCRRGQGRTDAVLPGVHVVIRHVDTGDDLRDGHQRTRRVELSRRRASGDIPVRPPSSPVFKTATGRVTVELNYAQQSLDRVADRRGGRDRAGRGRANSGRDDERAARRHVRRPAKSSICQLRPAMSMPSRSSRRTPSTSTPPACRRGSCSIA